MITSKKTIIHDEHTQDTITIRDTLLSINKGEVINITTQYGKQIKGTIIKIHHDISVLDDDDNIHYHCINIHVY